VEEGPRVVWSEGGALTARWGWGVGRRDEKRTGRRRICTGQKRVGSSKAARRGSESCKETSHAHTRGSTWQQKESQGTGKRPADASLFTGRRGRGGSGRRRDVPVSAKHHAVRVRTHWLSLVGQRRWAGRQGVERQGKQQQRKDGGVPPPNSPDRIRGGTSHATMRHGSCTCQKRDAGGDQNSTRKGGHGGWWGQRWSVQGPRRKGTADTRRGRRRGKERQHTDRVHAERTRHGTMREQASTSRGMRVRTCVRRAHNKKRNTRVRTVVGKDRQMGQGGAIPGQASNKRGDATRPSATATEEPGRARGRRSQPPQRSARWPPH